MKLKDLEDLILRELEKILVKIIQQKTFLPISARSRAGAEISNYLEDKFVKETLQHLYFQNSEGSPSGATKNPWDVKTFFKINDHLEEIWIDFKAIKASGLDSNPDIGSPGKVIKFIEKENFYIVYIYVYYRDKDDGLEFIQQENKFTKVYFLKDISKTFRRNPKNQLQVNLSAPPEYRTREEFIRLLFKKIKESHLRQIQISNKALMLLEQKEENLLEINKQSEIKILKKILYFFQ